MAPQPEAARRGRDAHARDERSAAEAQVGVLVQEFAKVQPPARRQGSSWALASTAAHRASVLALSSHHLQQTADWLHTARQERTIPNRANATPMPPDVWQMMHEFLPACLTRQNASLS